MTFTDLVAILGPPGVMIVLAFLVYWVLRND